MVEGSNQHLASLLAQGRLDLALVYRPQRNLDLTDEVLRAIPLLLVGPPNDSVLSGKDVIKFQDLAGLTLISPPGPASQVRSMLERHAASRGLVLTFGMEADSLSLQKVLVQDGMGYAALAATACESDVREGRLSAAKLVDPELSLTLALCRATSAPMTESARQCAKIIRRLVRDMIV